MFKINYCEITAAQWRGEVLKYPDIRAFGPTAVDAIRKTQVDLLRRVADQLEDERIQPVEFSIIMSPNTTTPEVAVYNLLNNLNKYSTAYELSQEDEEKKAAIIATIAALSLFLTQLGSFHRFVTPLTHLSMALSDLEHGTINPLLRPKTKPHNKPMDATRDWVIRACLAVALEVRIRLGDRVEDGATRVVRDAKKRGIIFSTLSRHVSSDEKRIVQLRKDFRRRGGTGPRDGHHRRVWSAYVEQAIVASRKAGSASYAELEQLYISAIEKAAHD